MLRSYFMKRVFVSLMLIVFLLGKAEAIDPDMQAISLSNCQINRYIQNDSITRVVYYDNNKIVKISEQYPTAIEVSFYEYTPGGLLSKVIYNYMEGADNSNKNILEYYYDSNNKVNLQKNKRDGKLTDSVVYSYPSSQLITAVRYTYSTVGFNDTILERYQLDANGNVLQKYNSVFRFYYYKNVAPASIRDSMLLVEENQYNDTLSTGGFALQDLTGIVSSNKLKKLTKLYGYSVNGLLIEQQTVFERDAIYQMDNDTKIRSIIGSSNVTGVQMPYKIEFYYDCW